MYNTSSGVSSGDGGGGGGSSAGSLWHVHLDPSAFIHDPSSANGDPIAFPLSGYTLDDGNGQEHVGRGLITTDDGGPYTGTMQAALWTPRNAADLDATIAFYLNFISNDGGAGESGINFQIFEHLAATTDPSEFERDDVDRYGPGTLIYSAADVITMEAGIPYRLNIPRAALSNAQAIAPLYVLKCGVYSNDSYMMQILGAGAQGSNG